MRNLVGMSLTVCVEDILDGHVKPEEVKDVVSNTTELVAPLSPYSINIYSGKRGAKYDDIIDRYSKSMWRKYKAPHIEEVMMLLIPKIREIPHTFISTWINANKPYVWEQLDDGWSFIGEYVKRTDGSVIYTVDKVREMYQKHSSTGFIDVNKINIAGIFAKSKIGKPSIIMPKYKKFPPLYPLVSPAQVPNP